MPIKKNIPKKEYEKKKFEHDYKVSGKKLRIPTPIDDYKETKPEREPEDNRLTEEYRDNKVANQLAFEQSIDKTREREKEKKKKEKKKEGSVTEIKKTYKNIQKFLDAVKLVSAGGVSCGDIFASAAVFLVTAHGEWIFSIIVPDYEIPWWKKMLVVMVDVVFLIYIVAIYKFVQDSTLLEKGAWLGAQFIAW